jgi:hypothetical protein
MFKDLVFSITSVSVSGTLGRGIASPLLPIMKKPRINVMMYVLSPTLQSTLNHIVNYVQFPCRIVKLVDPPLSVPNAHS